MQSSVRLQTGYSE